ncbi:hypothetical protein [Lactococcus protaetiae]|uniref:Uncharacterized protein n=1 Tax=Lactococcus protaetiae TaxID=2592653 RepID=A0A514ZA63_9LACT|nr:hypothetical protein [Lactococcus protaetiae]QDK71474.1 hypothetical protein FLP15_10255 [Lactococcus protaetiae]
MELIDEIKSSQNESHKKWFERWYKKIDLEKEIKTAANQGYTGYRIKISEPEDKYLKIRLQNRGTIDLLKEKLGVGFDIELKEIYGKNFLGINVYKSYIQISW